VPRIAAAIGPTANRQAARLDESSTRSADGSRTARGTPCRPADQSVWEFRTAADDGPAPRPANHAPPARPPVEIFATPTKLRLPTPLIPSIRDAGPPNVRGTVRCISAFGPTRWRRAAVRERFTFSLNESKATRFFFIDYRDRAGPCGPPLARIRTCGTTAYGSYLGCKRSNRTPG